MPLPEKVNNTKKRESLVEQNLADGNLIIIALYYYIKLSGILSGSKLIKTISHI